MQQTRLLKGSICEFMFFLEYEQTHETGSEQQMKINPQGNMTLHLRHLIQFHNWLKKTEPHFFFISFSFPTVWLKFTWPQFFTAFFSSQWEFSFNCNILKKKYHSEFWIQKLHSLSQCVPALSCLYSTPLWFTWRCKLHTEDEVRLPQGQWHLGRCQDA